MKMLRSLHALFLVCILPHAVLAQNQHIAYPNVAVMTPNAAALGMYSDIPVSYYVGVPEISIPLYEIDIDGFKIPITLSYHSSGIRVSQEATWVGLGWSLNAGGIISRQVNFVDDFLERDWDRLHPYVKKGFYDCPRFTTNVDSLYELSPIQIPSWVFLGAGYFLTADTEPDVFSYSIPGYSGKFMFGTDKQAVLFDKSHNIRVEVVRDGTSRLVTLKLTDGFGNQYFFDDKETTCNYLANDALYRNTIVPDTKYDDETKNYTTWEYIECFDNDDDDGWQAAPAVPYEMTSAWCLSRIVTNKGRTVCFTYENEEERLPTQESSEIYNSERFNRSQFFYRSKLINQGKRLKRISWDLGCVDFVASPREDMKGTAKKLDRMTVKNKNGDVLKDYQFSYSYFNDDYAGEYRYTHVFKRLKLTGLSEPSFSPGNGYTFSYYDGSFPAKNSKDTDYWGLQNGRTYGKDYCVGVIVNGRVFSGVTKEADFDHAVIGSLKQIDYPTGGYARFTYENNEYGGGIGVEVNNDLAEGTSHAGGPTSGTRFHLAACNNYFVNEHPELPQTDTLSFEIVTPSTAMSVSYHLENHRSDFKDPDYEYCSEPLLVLYRIADGGKKTLMCTKECPYLYERGGTGSIVDVGEGCENIGEIGKTLDAGRYELLVCCPPKDVSTEWDVSFDHLISLLDAGGQVVQPGYGLQYADHGGAGLRIAKIETNASTRTFTYPQGTMQKVPLYYYFGKRVGYLSTDQAALIQASESKTPLTTFGRGCLVGYDWVEERIIKANDTTCVRYYYMNEMESEQFDDKFPDSPYYINYTNGLLTKKEVYNNHTLLWEENMTYSSTKSDRIYAYRDKSERKLSDYTLPYYYDVEWPLVSSKCTILHEAGGNIVESSSFTYNSHDLPITESLTVGGKAIKLNTKYPVDFTDAVSLAMKDANIVAVPIETTKTVGGLVYDGEKLTYRQTGGLFLPASYSRLNASAGLSASLYSNRFVEEKQFTRYDKNGNPLEVSHNGEVTSYIWSYYGFYPIAEVRNATYSQVSSILGGEALSAIRDRWPTDAEITAFLAPLRNASVSNRFLVVSYSHKPLFGVTSVTEPSGMKSYFDYDACGRLQETRDTNLHTLQHYYYNYKH